MIKQEHAINNNKTIQSLLSDFWNYTGIPCPNLTQSDLCRSLINYGSLCFQTYAMLLLFHLPQLTSVGLAVRT